jgi:Flp pilus assembly protein TadG
VSADRASARVSRACCDRRLSAGRGQATVELVFVLPIVVAMALAVVQVAVVARRSILVVHAAREGARAAAVEPDPAAARAAARDAALSSSGLDPTRVQVEVVVDARDVVVIVRYDDPTDIALLGRLVGPVRLQERATMRREPS